ncbi:MAG: hypothetical protein ABI664_10615 [bacterium]
MRRSVLLAPVVLLAVASISSAQCPDGAPPPCKGAMPAALRRVNPPLDRRAWIVVPFGNVMKAPELDWLRDASVNLLSLDIGRWTDIRVVPDKRVGDLLRELPPARVAATLTLSDGLAIARRAGAGKLVMGDFFKVGTGARLVANVFDVSTGAKLRSAVQQAPQQDSLLTAFTPLARSVLAVPPPSDAKMGDLGTTRLDAYQEYLIGVRATNTDQMLDARTHLERAIALDSTFALAHFQLSYVLSWGDASNLSSESLKHALAAARLGAGLPSREHTLIDARVAAASREWGKACSIIAPMVARDSSDIEALFALGECSYHDSELVISPTDTLVARFRNSWNVSLRAFQRVLELDPSYYVAFEHISDILRTNWRRGCVQRPGVTGFDACTNWRAVVFRGGDSVQVVPARYPGNAWIAQYDRAAIEHPQLLNLRQSQAMAVRWLLADTTSERAHYALAQSLLALGDLSGANLEFAHTSLNATPENLLKLRSRIEIAIKLGQGAQARMLRDSLVKINPENPSSQYLSGTTDLSFGQFARWDAAVAARVTALDPETSVYFRRMGRAFAGVPVPDLDRLAWTRLAGVRDTTCTRECRMLWLVPSHAVVIGLENPTWSPAFAPPFADGRLRLAYAIATRDTTAMRKETVHFDTQSREVVGMGWPENGLSLLAANGYLALHDTAAALNAARFFVDTAMVVLPFASSSFCIGRNMCMVPTVLWTRGMLLRADLEAAKGSHAQAKIWYDKLLDLWSAADPEFQPVVERVRQARAALGK